jgi:hypothetical protein
LKQCPRSVGGHAALYPGADRTRPSLLAG